MDETEARPGRAAADVAARLCARLDGIDRKLDLALGGVALAVLMPFVLRLLAG